MVQLSLSEGFSYSAFEAMNQGIPVLVLKTISWNNIRMLQVNDFEDHAEMARKIDHVLSLSKKEYTRLSQNCIQNAKVAIAWNNNICEKNIRKILRS